MRPWNEKTANRRDEAIIGLAGMESITEPPGHFTARTLANLLCPITDFIGHKQAAKIVSSCLSHPDEPELATNLLTLSESLGFHAQRQSADPTMRYAYYNGPHVAKSRSSDSDLALLHIRRRSTDIGVRPLCREGRPNNPYGDAVAV